MVEQLWRTWAFAGLSGRPGLDVYAISPGLRQSVRSLGATVEAAYSFGLPEGTRLDTAPADIPVSLVFRVDGDTRVLAQRRYIGRDGHGRWGNYFAHVLLGFSPSFTIRQAIGLWSSPRWRNGIGDTRPGVTLPSITESELLAQAAAPVPFAEDLYEPIKFLIGAFLARDPSQSIYIVAEPDFVAELIAALATAVPATMLRDATFSTYEARPEAAPLTIVGTCGAPLVDGTSRPGFRLPDACLGGIVIDAVSGTFGRVDISPDVERYASFAAAELVEGTGRNSLDEVVTRAERARSTTPQELIEVHQWLAQAYGSSALRPPYVFEHLIPGGADLSLARAPVQEAVIRAVHTPWWQPYGQRALKQLTAAAAGDPRDAGAVAVLCREGLRSAIRASLSNDAKLASAILENLVFACGEIASSTRVFLKQLANAAERQHVEITADVAALCLRLTLQARLSWAEPAVQAALTASREAAFGVLESGSCPPGWRADIIAEGLRRGLLTDASSLDRLTAAALPDLTLALAAMAIDRDHVDAVGAGLRAIAKPATKHRLADVIKIVANTAVPPDLSLAAVGLVFDDESRDQDLLMQVIEEIVWYGSGQIPSNAGLCQGFRQTADAILGLPRFVRDSWNQRLSDAVLKSFEECPSLPSRLHARARALRRLHALLLQPRWTPDSVSWLGQLEEIIEGDAAVGADILASLAILSTGIVRSGDDLPLVESRLRRILTAPRARIVVGLLAGAVVQPTRQLPGVMACGLDLLLELDTQGEPIQLTDSSAWAGVQAWLLGSATAVRDQTVAEAFALLLRRWRLPRCPDLWLVLDLFFRAALSQGRNGGPPAASDVLQALRWLRQRPGGPGLGDWWTPEMRDAVAAAFQPELGISIALPDALDALAPPDDPHRGRVFTDLLKRLDNTLFGPARNPGRLQQIVADAVTTILSLTPAERAALVPPPQRYRRTTVYRLMGWVEDESRLLALADALSQAGTVSRTEVLVLALESRSNKAAPIPAPLIAVMLASLVDAPEATLRWALEPPRGTVVLGAILSTREFAAQGATLLGRLGPTAGDQLAGLTVAHLWALPRRDTQAVEELAERLADLSAQLGLSEAETSSVLQPLASYRHQLGGSIWHSAS